MEFYFNLEFITSLINEKLDDFIFDDFRNFIKNLGDSKIFIFTKNDVPKEIINRNPFFKTIIFHGNVILLEPDKLDFILQDETTTGFKFFFLNINNDTLDYIKHDFGFFYIKSNEINNMWAKFGHNQDLRKFISIKPGPHSFTSWKELNEFHFPIHSLVLADRYVFSDYNDLNENLFALLDNIGLKSLTKKKIDLLIIGENFNNSGNSHMKSRNNMKDNNEFEKGFKLVDAKLIEILGKNNYNLTFLKLDGQSIPKAKDFHWRLLFTNFLVINPGSSFNFFEKDRLSVKPKSTEFINFDFFVSKNMRGPFNEPLDLLKKAFTKITDRPAIGSEVSIKRSFVINEKKCRL